MSNATSDLRKNLLSSLVLVTCMASLLYPIRVPSLMGVYFTRQDMPVTILLTILFATLAFFPLATRITFRAPSAKLVWLAGTALALLLWWGTHVLMLNYPLTRDEHMVVFDAAIFGEKRLFMPLDPAWQPLAKAMVPAFLLDVPGHAFLVSAYGPGNAMMRAAFGAIFDPALMNPVLAGAGLIALHRVATRLFPDNQGAIVVCLLAYVLSAQVLVNAMTTYAMTPHLALNLIWLALFVEDRRWSHALAMVIGAWAIGLHQIIFHPLFAGPLLLTLLARGRWPLFSTYLVVYTGALLFWTSYPALLMTLAGVQATSGSGAGITGFIATRIIPLLSGIHPHEFLIMVYNLSRFVAWTPAFMLPLAFASWPAVRGNRGLALPLFAGFALTLLMMLIVLPYQGHGWGYRYLHPVLGNVMLLGGYGYMQLAATSPGRTNALVIACTAATLLVMPFLLYNAQRFVRPYAALTELVNRQQSDFVVVDTERPSHAIDTVRNRPDLSNRPLVFSSRDLTQSAMSELCRQGSITFITRDDIERAGLAPGLPISSPVFAWRSRILLDQDCLEKVAH